MGEINTFQRPDLTVLFNTGGGGDIDEKLMSVSDKVSRGTDRICDLDVTEGQEIERIGKVLIHRLDETGDFRNKGIFFMLKEFIGKLSDKEKEILSRKIKVTGEEDIFVTRKQLLKEILTYGYADRIRRTMRQFILKQEGLIDENSEGYLTRLNELRELGIDDIIILALRIAGIEKKEQVESLLDEVDNDISLKKIKGTVEAFLNATDEEILLGNIGDGHPRPETVRTSVEVVSEWIKEEKRNKNS